MKLVIDTNILIDAKTDYYHYANRIIDLVISGEVEAFANSAMLVENERMTKKKIFDPGHLKKLEYYFSALNLIESQERLDMVEDDPQDNKILETALAASADYLITSDNHLLKLEKFKKTKIVRPAEFWSRWEEEGEGWVRWLKNFIQT